eukprot:403349244
MNPTQQKSRILKVAGVVSAFALASVATIFALTSMPQPQNAIALAQNLTSANIAPLSYFCTGPTQKGFCYRIQIGSTFYPTFTDKFPSSYDQKVQSINIEAGQKVKLCKYENCADQPQANDTTQYDNKTANFIEFIGPYSTALLADGYSNWARSYQISGINFKPEVYVQAFSRPDFTMGAAGLFTFGDFDVTDIKQRFNSTSGNIPINSLIVPEGVVATIYSDEYLNGEGWVIYGPRKVNILEEKKNIDFEIKSIRVQKLNMKIIGKWERVMSTTYAPINTTVSMGWDSIETQIPESNLLNLFRTEAWQEGFKFQTEFEKTTNMTIPPSVKLFDASILTLKQSQITQVQASCPADPKLSQNTIALYQWTYKVQIDGKEEFQIYDTNFVCKYNNTASYPPACPLLYCADADCQNCLDQEANYTVTI